MDCIVSEVTTRLSDCHLHFHFETYSEASRVAMDAVSQRLLTGVRMYLNSGVEKYCYVGFPTVLYLQDQESLEHGEIQSAVLPTA